MKKKIVLYGALALVSYLFFVAAQTPADRVYHWAKAKLPLALYQIDGTVWQGRAAVATLGQRPQRLESLQWELQPAALLLARVQSAVSFRYDDRDFSGTLGRGLSGPYLHDFKGSLAAAAIETLSPQLAFGLSGLFEIEFDELALEGEQLGVVEGTIHWRDAGLELNNTTFGNFELVLTTADDKINGVVRDIDGPLKVNGTLLIQPAGDYIFAATIELRDNQRNDLRQGLRFIGTPNAKGVYTIKHQGQLPLQALTTAPG